MRNQAKPALPWQSYELNHQQPHDAPTLCGQPPVYHQPQYAAYYAQQQQAYVQQQYYAQQQAYAQQQYHLPNYLEPVPQMSPSPSPSPSPSAVPLPVPAQIARGSAPVLPTSAKPAAVKPDKRAAKQAQIAAQAADRKARAEAAARQIAERHTAVEKQLADRQAAEAVQLAAKQASAQHQLISIQLREVKRLEARHAAAVKVVRDRHAKVVRRAIGGVEPRTTERTRAQRIHRARTVKPGLDDAAEPGRWFVRLTCLALAIGAYVGLLYVVTGP